METIDQNDITKYLNDKVDKVDSAYKDMTEKKSQWIKHIITILVGSLTVFIAFKDGKSETSFHHQLFSLVLGLIGLSVISGIFYLYHVIHESAQILRLRQADLQQRLMGDFSAFDQTPIETKWYFSLLKYIFYVTFVLSFIFLVTYGIVIDK